MSQFQKTKILATVGPASNSYEVLKSLVLTGVDAFRLNFSHGTHEDHLSVFQKIDQINTELKTNVAVLADLQGPKLRVGLIENGKMELKKGDLLIFTNQECLGNKDGIYMSYPNFAQDVRVGEKVLVDDGKVELLVKETNQVDRVVLEVLYGEVLSSKKGVNLPDTQVSLPSLTEKDIIDLEFILTLPVNWIALSFVRNAHDLEDLRLRIQSKGHHARIIAKIEKPEAIKNIDSIIDAADGIMVGRGDLGVETPMERLPILQKMIIKKCLIKAKPVIVATQMMDSMIKNPSPTRAEINDVANAVLDGTDTVMLSAETASGDHPVKVVEAMRRIIAEAEKVESIYHRDVAPNPLSDSYLSDAVCYHSCNLAQQVGARMVIGMTKSGYTGFMVSSYRPLADIAIFSSDVHLLKTLNLVWGIRGFYYDKFTTTDETIYDVVEILKQSRLVEKGDIVINTGSMPLRERKKTNMLKLTIVR